LTRFSERKSNSRSEPCSRILTVLPNAEQDKQSLVKISLWGESKFHYGVLLQQNKKEKGIKIGDELSSSPIYCSSWNKINLSEETYPKKTSIIS